MVRPASSARPRNHLLTNLSSSDFDLLRPKLEALEFKRRDVLEEANKPIKHVYFPEGGMISVVAVTTRGRQTEAGIAGYEGMSGIPVIMGDDRSPHSTFIQIAGHGVRLKADDLRRALQESSSLQQTLLRFAQAFMIQTAHTALANGQATVEERLARWILMAHDRMAGNELPLTHEFLALMLSVRRAGVTVALNILEERGVISAKRSLIVVIDRNGLETIAAGLYGIPEAEYRRLTGWKPKH